MLTFCNDLMISSCLMMARLPGGDKNKLLAWSLTANEQAEVKIFLSLVCDLLLGYRLVVLHMAFRIFTRPIPAKSAILSQPWTRPCSCLDVVLLAGTISSSRPTHVAALQCTVDRSRV